MSDGPEPPLPPPGETYSPDRLMARECLRAVGFGKANFGVMANMFVLMVAGVALFGLVVPVSLWIALGAIGGPLGLVGLVGVIQIAVGGCLLQFCLNAMLGPPLGDDRAPDRPLVRLKEWFALGLRGLGLYVVYVLPVFTLPLLPLGLLALAYTGDGRALDVAWALRAARRAPVGLAILWGFILLWLTAMMFGFWGLIAACVALASVWSLGVALLLPIVLLAGAIAVMFATIIFRCIGIFAKYNPLVEDSIPDEPNWRRTLVFLLIGLAVSAAVQTPNLLFLARLAN